MTPNQQKRTGTKMVDSDIGDEDIFVVPLAHKRNKARASVPVKKRRRRKSSARVTKKKNVADTSKEPHSRKANTTAHKAKVKQHSDSGSQNTSQAAPLTSTDPPSADPSNRMPRKSGKKSSKSSKSTKKRKRSAPSPSSSRSRSRGRSSRGSRSRSRSRSSSSSSSDDSSRRKHRRRKHRRRRRSSPSSSRSPDHKSRRHRRSSASPKRGSKHASSAPTKRTRRVPRSPKKEGFLILIRELWKENGDSYREKKFGVREVSQIASKKWQAMTKSEQDAYHEQGFAELGFPKWKCIGGKTLSPEKAQKHLEQKKKAASAPLPNATAEK